MGRVVWSLAGTGGRDQRLVAVFALGVARPASYSEAEQALVKLRQADLARAADLKILRLSEVDLAVN